MTSLNPTGPKKSLPTWARWVLVAVIAVCAIGFIASLGDDEETPQIQPAPTDVQPAAEPTADAPAPEPVTVSGSGNALADIGATLNGRFRLDYTAGSFCIIVDFLKADGSDGGDWDSGVNECAEDTDVNASGSRVVELHDATMVQVDNTHGPWSLTLTPLG